MHISVRATYNEVEALEALKSLLSMPGVTSGVVIANELPDELPLCKLRAVELWRLASGLLGCDLHSNPTIAEAAKLLDAAATDIAAKNGFEYEDVAGHVR